MSDRYWVGGTGNWSDTAHWSTTDGGASGAAVPTAADSVFFTNLSSAANAAYTATLDATGGGKLCLDFNMAGPGGGNKVTWAGSQPLTISGSMNLSGGTAGITRSYTGTFTFNATATGKTVDPNGISFGSALTFSGIGGGWTLSNALSTTNNVTVNNGTFDSNNKNITAISFSHTGGTATITLGTSTLFLGGNFNFGTGGATLSSSSAHLDFNNSQPGVLISGLSSPTFNSLNCSSMIGGSITGAVTFNGNVTFTFSNYSDTGMALSGTLTVGGTLTVSSGAANVRGFVKSDTYGTSRTISAAAVSITNADFQDIAGTGAAAPFTGTRVGDAHGNSGITFTTGVNKYYVGNTANWNATVWATASGGAAAANNFPLPQDTAVFDGSSFSANNQTVTVNGTFRLPAINFSAITKTGITYATAANATTYFGNVTLESHMAVSGTSAQTFAGRVTQTITSAGVAWTQAITVDSLSGTFSLGDNFSTAATRALTLTSGTVDLNGKNGTFGTFSSTGSVTRTLTLGTGTLSLSGNAATIFNAGTVTNLTLNRGSNPITLTYSGATGTRTMTWGNNASGTEARAPDVLVNAGTDTIATSVNFRDLDMTGFAGTWANGGSCVMYGNLTVAAGITRTFSGNIDFNGTGSQQVLKTNGVALSSSLTINGSAGLKLFDNLTNAGSAFTLTSGSFDANSKSVTLNGTGTQTITGAFTFADLILQHASNVTTTVTSLGSDITVSGTLTVAATGPRFRRLLSSNTTGTARTVTAAAISLTDADFADITGAGVAAPWTGTRLGDAKGNSGITLTAAAPKYYVGNTANWNDASVWATSSGGVGNDNNQPLPQDTAVFDANSFSANSQTLTINAAFRLPALDFSAITKTGITLANGTQTPTTYGNITLESHMSITGTGDYTVSARTPQTITSAGVAWTQQQTVGFNSTLKLGDQLTFPTLQLQAAGGTIDLNGKRLILTSSFSSALPGNVKTVKSSLNGGVIECSSTAAGVTFNGANGVVTDLVTGSWSIEMSGNTTNTRQFAGGGATWPTVTFTNTTANGRLDFTGSNTFTALRVSAPPQTIGFTAGTTTTIQDSNGFPSGTAGNLVTIASITAANHSLAKSGGGVISSDYLSISRSQASPATTWYAGTHSTDGGNNSGWVFTAPPGVTHDAPGVLVGDGSAVAGSAARTRVHASSGSLTGAGSAVAGSAARTRVHASSGVLAGPGSIVIGAAARFTTAVTHDATGTLIGEGSTLEGVAAHIPVGGVEWANDLERKYYVQHHVAGRLIGDGSSLQGAAEVVRTGQNPLALLLISN